MKLADWMAAHDVDDAKMAALVDCDRSTISRIRRGKYQPPWKLIARIKKVTKSAVDVADFVGASERAA